MRLEIGRLRGDLALLNVKRWNRDGEIANVTGSTPLDRAESLIVQERILGLVDNRDEETVPVTFDANPAVDGFYRVLSARVEPYRFPLGRFPWSMSLQRVPGYASPLIQSTLAGTVRANGLGIISAFPWHSVPNAAMEYGPLDQLDNPALVTRAADGVSMLFRDLTTHYNRTIQYYLAPASFYAGSAVLEVGATLRPVVGRQVENSPLAWRLSNGLVRVTPSASAGRIDVAHYDGTQWDTAKTYRINVGGLLLTDFKNITVLRNSPEETIIRLSAGTSGTINPPIRLDLSLRRGSRILNCVTSAVYGANTTAVITSNTAEASTALAGGIRATSNDASGNRFLLLSGRTTATDLVNGAITVTSLSATKLVHPFGIASEVGGSAAVLPDTATNIHDQYFAAQAEAVTMAGR